MKRLILGASAFVLMAGAAQAQDVHFTQYFSSPLTLNPALSGLVQNDLRAAFNYRSQWSSVSSNPYTTFSGSYDMATLKDKFNNGDALGIGILGMYDRAGIGSLQNTSIGLSVAYHKALGRGEEKNHTISIGVQGYLVQKSVDFSKLRFEDQFDRGSGVASLPTNEVFGNQDLTYPDFNAGLMYTGRVNDYGTIYGGYSIYHLSTPEETFLAPSASDTFGRKIHMRHTATLGGSFKLNENVVLYASGLFQQQAKATEVVIGGAAGFVLNPGYDEDYQRQTVLYTGAWYRANDAIAPYVGLEFKKMTIGFSYDVNVSNFTAATNANGAYELTLTFNGAINKRNPMPRYNFACPKF